MTHKCFCAKCATPKTCPLIVVTNQYKAIIKQNNQLKKELSCLKKIQNAKENTTCPSYDEEECVTYPTPYSVKCKEIDICRWKTFDFKKHGLKIKEEK